MRKKSESKLFLCFIAAIIGILFSVRTADAQQRMITGQVMDSVSQAALSLASVYIVNTEGTILHYTFTDERGAFHLTLPSRERSLPLWLKVSYLGYKSRRIAVDADHSSYYLTLTKDTNRLKEVVVHTRPPIEQLGDTTRYHVEKFSQTEDRSIGDVLKRMPGIEVADDGTLYFNGKKISNLYIGGDDLMNGRYGMATQSIRKEMIESVDIMRNFQPIKVLKNKIHSDKTALNLRLKDPHSLKLSVNAMAGGGFPSLYDASATGILLNNRFKALNNLALNNSGVNYTNNFKQLGASNFTSPIHNNPSQFDLSLATIGPPDLPLPNYYFNHSGVINLNDMYKTKNDVKFKVNIQAFRDKNSMDYFSQTNNYLSDDTISYREQQALTNHKSLWNSSFNVMVNKDSYFFDDHLSLGIVDEDNISFMDFNDYNFNQSVHKKIRNFSNDLNWVPALSGKGIGELRWLISYNKNNQLLDLGKGYYFQMPGQEGHYDDVVQNLVIPTLSSNLYLGYKIPGTVITQEYTAGALIQSEDFRSDLSLIQNGSATSYAGDAGNDLHWRQHDIYLSAKYQIRHERLRTTVMLPLSYQIIHYYQQEYNLDRRKNYFVFIPSIKISYDFDPEHFLNISYAFNNDISDMLSLFRGGVLKNYRVFMANDADIQQKATHSLAATYKFQKAINMLFFNTGISYDRTIADVLLSTEFMDDIQKTIFLPYPNKQSRFSLKAGVSKYLFKLKTTASLKARWSRYNYMEMVNNTVQPFYGNALLLRGKLMKKIRSGLALVYKPAGIWSNTRSGGKNSTDAERLRHHAFRLDQHLSLEMKPVKDIKIDLTAKHSFSKESNENAVQYFFMDAEITYSNSQKGVDLSCSLTNIFNVTGYIRYHLTPYQSTVDRYRIRGRMAVFRLKYYF